MQTNPRVWTRLIALSSCLLAAGSLMLALATWGWFLTRPSGAFGEMGGLVFILVIFPISLCAWLVGGPVALALGGYAAKRVRSGNGNPFDGELAQSDVILSRVMLWGGLWGGVGLLVLEVFLHLLRAPPR